MRFLLIHLRSLFSIALLMAAPVLVKAWHAQPFGESLAPAVAQSGKIAFISSGSSGSDIFLMDGDGNNLLDLTQGRVTGLAALAWSPDGSQLVFAAERGGNLYLVNADGSNLHRLTNNVGFAITQTPTWSPDGTQIAYIGNAAQNYDVFIINPDGSNQRRLTNTNSIYRDLAWSPDGNFIAYASGPDFFHVHIFLMKADGSSPRQLSVGDGSDLAPAWSPDGSKIAYENDYQFGPPEIFVMKADGGNQTRLTNNFEVDSHPTWSPDGSKIAFSTNRDIRNGPYAIYVMNPDGSSPARLTDLSRSDVYPAWQPVKSSAANSIDDAQFFVRQQYLDFLNRQPEADGLGYWTSQITNCGTDARCIHDHRVAVADAFFFEAEFQQTGAYIYRIIRAGLGQRPSFAQFMADRGSVVTGAGLDQSKTAYAVSFVQRDAFLALYPRAQSADQFVDALLDSIKVNSGVDLSSQRSLLINLYDGTDNGRGAILRQLADSQSLIDAEYNSSFVLMQYFGYLRRDAEPGGFEFWLGQVNKYPLRDVGIQHAMACSFITSTEYQQRFGSIVTHSNRECAP